MPIHKTFSKEARLRRKAKRAGRKISKKIDPYMKPGGIQKAQAELDKFEEKGTKKLTQRGRRKEIGAAKGTKVSRGAVGVEKTKGGEYVKYAKKSKAAGKFRSAFKSGCAGGAKSFTWQGRSYTCAKK
jgi:hypothetical protein